jgi:4-hydroxybenzoate polyprenyltransferase
MGWRYVNILSLDIAVGAVVGCAFFSRLFGVTLRVHAFLSLGLIVWIVYTVDHLLDAGRINKEPSTDRHRFHSEHRTSLWIGVLLAMGIVGVEAFLVRSAVLYAGIAVASLVIIYLLIQPSLGFMKEVAIAVLYSAGVVSAPVALLDRPLLHVELLQVFVFFLTAYLNLVIFSWYDRFHDEADGHHSVVTRFGERVAKAIIGGTLIVILVMLGLLAAKGTSPYFILTLSAMNSVHFAIFHFPRYFGLRDRHRHFGDAVFLLPALTLLNLSILS